MELLTDEEKEAMELTVVLFNKISCGVVGMDEQARPNDMREVVHHIHGLQRLIMAQAACRAYPEKYRLLGETLPSKDSA